MERGSNRRCGISACLRKNERPPPNCGQGVLDCLRKDLGILPVVLGEVPGHVQALEGHDALGEYLRPSLQGFRRSWGGYQPIPLEADGSLLSRTTGLRFKREGQRLRLVDVLTGEPILWPEEEKAARQAAQKRAAEETAARQSAERRAAEEADARQSAERRAAEEAAAREAMEQRLRALEEELSRLRQAGRA